jgi:hypothetical protein
VVVVVSSISEADIAWAAGLFEGEGAASPNNGYPRLQMEMCDLDVLQRLQRVLGGNINGPYQRTRVPQDSAAFKWASQPRPHYHWSINRRPLVELAVELMWPWLHERRRAQCIAAGVAPSIDG